MADTRLTDKGELTSVAVGDKLEVVDISDTSANAAGTTKWITKDNLVGTPFGGASTDLTDVDETTLDGNEGKVLIVTVDPSTTPNTRKLNFQRLPTYQDLYGGNAIIKGGILFRGTLLYTVWATNYVIGGRYFSTAVTADVTVSNGDATHPRIDVFCVEIDINEPPNASIVIIEGTPSASPVKPTVNLRQQVEVSFRTVAASESTDPTTVTEVIYNENTGEPSEWDLTDTPTGANMADTTDPKVGTYAITLPALTTDVLEFTKASLYTIPKDGSIAFWMRIALGLTPKSKVQIQLRENSTGFYHLWSSKIVDMLEYGFSSSNAGWQLVQIPIDSFSANTRTQTQFDEFEMVFDYTPILEIDWIVLQSDIITPVNNPITEIIAGTGIAVDSSSSSRPTVSASLPVYTVSTLPTGTVGDRAYVTDATTPTYGAALTGGGAVVVPVFRNATVWVSA